MRANPGRVYSINPFRGGYVDVEQNPASSELPSLAIPGYSLNDQDSSGELDLQQPLRNSKRLDTIQENGPLIFESHYPLELTLPFPENTESIFDQRVDGGSSPSTDHTMSPENTSGTAHTKPANGISHSYAFRMLKPNLTRKRSQMYAEPTKPFLCSTCSKYSICPKSYGSKGALRRHEKQKHGAERKTGGRPSNSSRRLC